MKRRQFIAGLGGSVAWPLAEWAQQPDQALSIGQLRKPHGPILLGTAQCSHLSVAIVTYNNPCKRAPGQKIHELGEKRFAGVHRRLLGKTPNGAKPSNRHCRLSPATSCQISSFRNALRGQPDSSDLESGTNFLSAINPSSLVPLPTRILNLRRKKMPGTPRLCVAWCLAVPS